MKRGIGTQAFHPEQRLQPGGGKMALHLEIGENEDDIPIGVVP